MAERDRGARAIIPLEPYQVSVSYQGTVPSQAGWFGALQPLAPVAPPSVAGRRWDYPSGYNISTRPRQSERIGFAELRALADNYDLLRIVIETRKDQVELQPWSIRPNADQFGPGKSKPTQALRDRCRDIQLALRKPDRETGFKPWLRALLEDLFVIDAPAIYRRPTRGGGIYGYEVIDGATIVPKIDDSGRIAMYQQVLKGLPAVDYGKDELIYRPRNVRSNRVYGFSPVEQVIMTVNIALRRQIWQLQFFTEGNIPDALIGVPSTWTPDQIMQFQTWWDSVFEGNTAQRRHAKFVPDGVGKAYVPTKDAELYGKTDEWLARVVCFAFSIPPSPFVAQVNRATAQTAKEQAIEEGLGPILQWVGDLFNDIIVEDFGEPDCEFAWGSEVKTDPKDQETILTGYASKGVMRFNEVREKIGLEPDDNPAADMLGIIGPSGFIPIEANTIEGKKASFDAFGPPTIPGALGDGGQPGNGGGKPPPNGAPKPDAAKTEAEKLAKAKRARRLAPIPFDRREGRRAVRLIKASLASAFATTATKAANSVRAALAKASDRTKADEIADGIDLSDIEGLSDDIGEALSDFAGDTAGKALAQLGVDSSNELVNQVNERAVKAARDRAAELVSLDGDDNIIASTRDMLRDIIASGLQDNIGLDEIAANIEEATAFSADRAELIARTEVGNANSDAALEGYRSARDDLGLNIKKVWLTAEDDLVSEECAANGEQGAIDLDEDFESGDDAPLAHPGCRCSLSVETEEDDQQSADDTEKLAKGGPGSGPHPGGGGSKLAGLKDKAKAFVNSSGANDVIASAVDKVATKLKDPENVKSLLSGAVVFGMYHGLQADFPADVEHAIRHEVEHLASNAKIAVDQARGMMKAAVAGLISLRANQAKARKAAAKDDELLAALKRLAAILDDDAVFADKKSSKK